MAWCKDWTGPSLGPPWWPEGNSCGVGDGRGGGRGGDGSALRCCLVLTLTGNLHNHHPLVPPPPPQLEARAVQAVRHRHLQGHPRPQAVLRLPRLLPHGIGVALLALPAYRGDNPRRCVRSSGSVRGLVWCKLCSLIRTARGRAAECKTVCRNVKCKRSPLDTRARIT